MSAKSFMARLKAEMQPESVLPLPLVAFYGREMEAEDRRTRMNNMVERHFRNAPIPGTGMPAQPGFGGQGAELRMLDPRTSRAWVNVASAPLEWLAEKQLLADEKASAGYDADQFAGIRFRACMETRELYEAAAIPPLNSIDWLRVSGGGGAAGFSPSHHMIDASKKISKISEVIRRQEHRVLGEQGSLESLFIGVVVGDEWPWVGLPKKKKAAILSRLRLAMDCAAVALRILPSGDLEAHWPVYRGERRPVRRRDSR